MREIDIIHTAFENLEKNTDVRVKWDESFNPKDVGIDGIITLEANNKTYHLFIEAKKTLRNHQVRQIKEQANNYNPLLIVVEHIFPKIKEELRNSGIAYLEANGNIYIKEEGLFMWIDHNKPIEQEKEQVNRAFTKTGLKVVYHFLLNEELVNNPYRDIAQITGTGLGNVTNVINGMKQAGYLLRLNKSKYMLSNRKELLHKWVDAYAGKLQPTLHLGNFRFLKEDDYRNWKQIPLMHEKTFWGGEPAANILTDYLRPEIFTIYTDELKADLIKQYRLIPDENGKVKVYKKFWNYRPTPWNTVDPILVYADLMNTGDNRNIETANKINDEFLQNKF